MKTRPEDFAIINQHLFPSLLGTRRFKDVGGNTVHMAYNEAAVFQSLLSALKPKHAVEVGTETGATLAIIARHAERTISIDIDPGVKTRVFISSL